MSFCVIIIKPHIQQQLNEKKKNPYFSRITICRKMPLSEEINNFIKIIHILYTLGCTKSSFIFRISKIKTELSSSDGCSNLIYIVLGYEYWLISWSADNANIMKSYLRFFIFFFWDFKQHIILEFSLQPSTLVQTFKVFWLGVQYIF